VAGFDPATGAVKWRVGEDVAAYQTPVVLNVGGRELVMAVGDKKLFGIEPATGRLVFEHAHGAEDHPMGAESIVPVPAGEGRLFLKLGQESSTMLRLAPADGGRVAVETLWSAPVLRGTYVVPVHHGGHLYGMSGRATLACVDAATGELRWRSREPGDGFPLIVGDDLVVLTKERTLHVAKASPEGWRERARLELFKDVVWSPAGFADGAVFARSQGEIARVDWRAGDAARVEATRAPVPVSRRFARFLQELDAAPDKSQAVDRLLASIPPGPLVEWPDRVVFLYRGAAQDAGFAGDMNGDRREDPMWRVPGTDLFWYEATLEADARVSYHFVRDFEERFPDPRNPWRVPGPPSGTLGVFPKEQSSLAMPGWRAPDHHREPEAGRRGRLESHVVASTQHPGATITVTVYVPAGYDKDSERLPVALLTDGDGARELGLVPRSLDNLIPERVAPLLVAFLGRPQWGEKPPEDRSEALADLLAKDVVGFLDSRYRTYPAPDRRALVGTGFSGASTVSVLSRRPTAFGALGLQSLWMLDSTDEQLRKHFPSAAEVPLRIYVDWGRHDRRATREAWDMRAATARFVDFLRDRGYRPAGGEIPEGTWWSGWRNHTDRLFAALFPPAGGGGTAIAEPIPR
jgi:enterochelin esterase-like enzyme